MTQKDKLKTAILKKKLEEATGKKVELVEALETKAVSYLRGQIETFESNLDFTLNGGSQANPRVLKQINSLVSDIKNLLNKL